MAASTASTTPLLAFAIALSLRGPALAQDDMHHDHPAPERLGTVAFQTSCNPAVAADFDRAVALLHSFTYTLSKNAFAGVLAKDPHCAMALWGMAMTHYHELWEPPIDSLDEFAEGQAEIRRAAGMEGSSPEERQFIDALGQYYLDPKEQPRARAERYARAMSAVAKANPGNDEAQIFYALSLIATASPMDKTHANDKEAAGILDPIWRRLPDHPGLAHYLIHAYDSAELAPKGLAPARAYSKIAPSAPHALHMPSHIFTRLGLWNESIASNLAARDAARMQGDIGEELHAMDYLTYAYLQLGRDADAGKIVAAARAMTDLPASQFKIAYAATAMPVRLAVETGDWAAAAGLEPMSGSPARVEAIAFWARALGNSRGGHAASSDADIAKLQNCLDEVRASADAYWTMQTEVLLKEAQAWSSAAKGDTQSGIAMLRSAADEEDAMEKLPVTPGPIVPAREQLGELLLSVHQPAQALSAFKAALALAPGRRGASLGAIEAAKQTGDGDTVSRIQASMQGQQTP